MSKQEYKENRTRVFEIMGIDPKSRNHNCHHCKIYRREAKRDPELRQKLDKIDNLFPLTNEEHTRLHRMEDEMTGYRPDTRRKPKKKSRRRKH